jgi:molybdopterin-guanine dinucleotide biosynthesis protein A
MSQLAAVILCGGRSTRMGRPKAWLPFGDELLLQRVVRLVGEGVGDGPIAVVAAPGQDLPELPPGTIVAHDPVEGRGPLQGLAAGLAVLPGEAELVYATATDVPFLRPAWIARLAERIGEADLAMPFALGHRNPLAALYRRSVVLPAVRELLAEDLLKPAFLLDRVRAVVLTEGDFRDVDPGFETLRNLNTPEDYAEALRDAGLAAGGRG